MIKEQRSKFEQNVEAAAIIVAGGHSARYGGPTPKQFTYLGDKRVIEWSVAVFREHVAFTKIIVVLPAGYSSSGFAIDFADGITLVDGGETRTQSVLKGMDALSQDFEGFLFVHDAARPGITKEVIDELIAQLQHTDCAAPAIRLVDALKRVHNSTVEAIPRDYLYRVQTPQAFHWPQLKSVLSDFAHRSFPDDLELAEAAGLTIGLVEGDERLRKLTYPSDKSFLEKELLKSPSFRTGQGFDVHAFGPGSTVWLCGVPIPHTQALEGHSDADVAWHALTDAILGAAVAGDIGDHFPPSDDRWKGSSSDQFLKYAVELARTAGGHLEHVDITIICEGPKIKSFREQMRITTADVLECDMSRVSVKATTTEKLGFLGRSEGIAAQAVATLSFT